MNKFKKITIGILTFICVICAAFAVGCSDKTTYYSVTFMDGQTQIGETLKVKKGGKISDYPTAGRADPDDVFDGWFKDENFTKVWNGDIERVTKDTTLWANFLHVSAAPNNVAMTDTAFSNTVSWLQREITEDSNFTVKILGTDVVSGGREEFSFESYKGHADILTVKWTPSVKPAGGEHSVEIADDNEHKVTAGNLIFKGAGEEGNPYLVYSQTDLSAMNTADVSGGYYKLAQSFTAKISSDDVADKTFNGKFDGKGKTITVESSGYGLFGTLGSDSEVKDLTVAGAVNNVQTNCVGMIAGVNRGKISYCTVTAALESKLGTVGTLSGDKDGIEGGIAGIAGINYGEISCCKNSGTIKAGVGGAGIAVINNGTVSLCSFTGTIGASAGADGETGKTTKAYSYLGGIVSVNYATVEKSALDGSGKILAQRAADGANDYVGGIAALNQTGATVKECRFDGIRVHGNKNVGGIVGANSGTVTHCYAGGAYHGGNAATHSYVGGLSEVGGIVGLTNGGTVTNCFVTSNVYGYSGNAYKVSQNAKNSVYISGNTDNRNGTVSNIASEENGNIKIDLTGDYAAKNYALVLTEEQLAALNGGVDAFVDKDNVRLACESESTVIEHIITVVIDENEIGTVSSVSGNKILLKDYTPEQIPENHYFAGWAVSQNGEVAFAAGAQVDYAALTNYGERVTLYPVFKEGENPLNKVLDVAVYAQYVDEEMFNRLLEAFKVYCNQNNIEVTSFGYTMIGDGATSVGDFCTAVQQGDFNVMFGQRANLTIPVIGNADTLLKVKGSARRIAKISEGTAANAFYDFVLNDESAKDILDPDYITEAEADKIEITLMNGATQYGEKLTASSATDAGKVTLPDVTPEDGFTFAGWALTAEAAVGETLLKGDIGYGDVKNLATGNALTLYARFTQTPQKPSVVIAIHSSASSSTYITAEEIDKIKNGFASYLTSQGYEDTEYEIVWHVVTGKNGSGFDTAVNGYGNVNVAVGGNAMGLTFDATRGKADVKSGMFANTSRKVGILSGSGDNELAVLFYQYMTGTENA